MTTEPAARPNPAPARTERAQWLAVAASPLVALGLLNALYQDALFTIGPGAYWAADVAHFVVLPLLAVVLLARLGFAPSAYGFGRPRSRREAFDLASAGVLVLGLFALSYHLAGRLALQALGAAAEVPDVGPELPPRGPARAALVAYLACTAAFMEEGVYRGAWWAWLSARLGEARAAVPYVLSSAFVFAWIHSEQGLHSVAAAGALGAVACLLYLRVRSLWPFVLAHAAMNLYLFW